MPTPLNVLLVEDSEDDALLVLMALRQGGFQPQAQRVETADTLRAALTHQPWDVVISDYRLPQFTAAAALDLIQQSQLDLPFIVVSGTIGDASAIELMRAGAHDYLLKGNLARLPEAVRREIRDAQIRAERQQADRDLHLTRERLQLALEASGIGLWDWSVQTGAITLNDRWAEILGYRLAELAPMRIQAWYDHTHPEDLPMVTTLLEQHFRREIPVYECELRMRHRAGHWVWVWARGTVVEWDAAGLPRRMAGTHLDITDRKRDEAERQQAADQILYNSLHDALTDLPNRNFLMQRLELAMQRSQRSQRAYFALLFLDLDHFKVINDSLGHLAGDEVLSFVAQKVRSLIRASDMAARLGGDEFVLLLEDVESLQDPVHVADRLFAELQRPCKLANGREVYINSSIGIVMGAPEYQSPADLLRDADTAMYRAKDQGRAGYVIFNEEMHVQALQRLQLEQDLRHAIDQGELVVYYQPIIHLATGHLCGFEALVRWPHPTHGFIEPEEFVPIAEETGLIVSIDRRVLYTACHQMAIWWSLSPQSFPFGISINLSAQDLRQPHLLEDIDQILAETGLAGDRLTLEITESMLIEDIDQTLDLLAQLKLRKIQISIDDFGTGYSSLSYLHRLPADCLKIDSSFVSQMQAESRNYQVVSTIITLSHQLGVKAVAEGVESEQQQQWLQQLGCEWGQGYFFSPPLTADQVEHRFFQAPLPLS